MEMDLGMVSIIAILMTNAITMRMFDGKDSIKRVFGVLALNNLICFSILGILFLVFR